MAIPPKLSRREREILDILHELGEATAQEVRERLAEPPSNSAARALLARLEKKGAIGHEARGLRYVYSPAVPTAEARESAIRRLARVFYDGSLASAVSGMVEHSGDELSEEELEALEDSIRRARERRKSR